MKKLMVIMYLLSASLVAEAQEGFTKGSLFISGNLGYSSITVPSGPSDEKYSEFMFTPSVGYFISDNIAVGLVAGIGFTNYDEGVYEERESTLIFGGFGRYYFTPANKFSFLLEASAAYVSTNYEETLAPDFKTNGFALGFAPGLNYFLSNRFALQTYVGLLGFGFAKPNVDGADATTNFNFNVGLNNVTFGLVYKLK